MLLTEHSDTFHLPKLSSSALMAVLNLLEGLPSTAVLSVHHSMVFKVCGFFSLFLIYYMFKSQEAKEYFVVKQC